MTKKYYLVERGATKQFRISRRATATGAIVVHTAETKADLVLPDARAEAVANFIATREDYGSYHRIGDSDSRVALAPYGYETWHVGTKHPDGSGLRANSISLGYCFACYAKDWPNLPNSWIEGAIEQAAAEFAEMNEWIKDLRGYEIPARRITPAEFWAGKPGFISHHLLDPARRSDPGEGFPWFRLMKRYAEVAHVPFGDLDTSEKFTISLEQAANLREIQRELASRAGYDGEIDALFGPKTMAAFGRLTAKVDDLGLITERMDSALGDAVAAMQDNISKFTEARL